MDFPVIPTPVFPRWVWMEEVTFSHIPIATMITAFMILAPIFEYLGYRKKDLRYDRLSKSMIYFSLIIFSPGAALGTGIPMIIMGLYPEFWSRWANIFFWPLIVQFVFFTFEVVFLFFFYYLPWDRMMHRKKRHITYGAIAMAFGLLIQVVWDAIGSYMLTPGAPFPKVNEPVGFSLQGFLNPSFPFLFAHRFFGNISYVMLLTGGVLALKYLFAKNEKNKNYYGFATNFTFSIGFIAFFAQPVIGWFYAKVIQSQAPVAFHAIMGGHASGYFLFKLIFISVFLTIGGVYFFKRYRNNLAFLIITTILILSTYIILTVHPPLRWFGNEMNWRIGYTVIYIIFLGLLWLVRFKGANLRIHKWQWIIFIAGIASFLAFFMGGNMRERARSPQTVYGYHEKPEALDYERNRFLTYERCIKCHHKSARDLKLKQGEDWESRVRLEMEKGRVSLTEEESNKIIQYLKEFHNAKY